MMVIAMALPMNLRTVSPMPMGCKPGHLSKAMSLQATNADNLLGSTKQVLSRLVTDARVSHNPVEADLNEVRSHFRATVSRREGPAAPSILRAVRTVCSASSLKDVNALDAISEAQARLKFAVEQHGHHLPLKVDHLCANAVATEGARLKPEYIPS